MRFLGMILLATCCGCGDPTSPTNQPTSSPSVAPVVRQPLSDTPTPSIGACDIHSTCNTPDDFLSAKTSVTGLTADDLIARSTPESLELWKTYDVDTKRIFVPYADALPITEAEAKLCKAARGKDAATWTLWFEVEHKDGQIIRFQPCYKDDRKGTWFARVNNRWVDCPKYEADALRKHYPHPVIEPREPMSSIKTPAMGFRDSQFFDPSGTFYSDRTSPPKQGPQITDSATKTWPPKVCYVDKVGSNRIDKVTSRPR